MALTVAPDFTDGILTAAKLQQLSDAINQRTPLSVIKSLDEPITSDTALQNDNELLLPVESSATYNFALLLRYDATAASDIKTGFSVPSSTTMQYVAHGIAAGGTVYNLFDQNQASTPTFEGAGAGTIRNATYVGTITTSSTAGTVNFQFAQGTSGGTATISKTGSLFFAVRMS